MRIKNVLSALGLVFLFGMFMFAIGGFFINLVKSDNYTNTVTVNNVPQLNFTNKLNVTKKNIHNFELSSDRVVFINGPIESVDNILNDIKRLSKDNSPIWLLINSPGGSVLDGALVISAIEASKVPVYTVCMQICASMAAIIHQYGTKRYMVDRSILMFHNASGGAEGPVPQMISRLKLINNYVLKMDSYVASRSGQTLDQFVAKLGNEVWLDAEDSMKEKYSDGTVSVLLKGSVLIPLLNANNQEMNKIKIQW